MAEIKCYKIVKGLDVPIDGEPVQRIDSCPPPMTAALMAADYTGLRPAMLVEAGDLVKRGQPLFEDKKNPGVLFTSPAAGEVLAINRGEKRALISVVIAFSEKERAGEDAPDEECNYAAYSGKDIAALSRADIRALLLETGLWTAFRARPFSKIPAPNAEPHAIFITATDTNPLAPSVDVVVAGNETDFVRGQIAVAKLTDGFTHLCKTKGSNIPSNPNTGLIISEFDGPHPAGTPGFHIHTLEPVHREKTVWHIGYQDVIAIGKLIRTGRLDLARVVSLAGPSVKSPRLLKIRLGASIDGLIANEVTAGVHRAVSGSVLSGRRAMGEVEGYLGRYHLQVSVLPEGGEREFLGWMMPGKDKFSIIPLFLSRLLGNRRFSMTTNLNGGIRPIVPVGAYERVMPMDILPTHLLRALACNDVEQAEKLGCLELDEEDLALCTFVCPCKNDYGPMLRRNLDAIEKEG